MLACKESFANAPEENLAMHLQKLHISEETYVSVLQKTTARSKIIPARDTKDMRVNQYNSEILEMWKANMDIQFVENAMVAVMYVCSYMMKSEKGMGELLRAVGKEVSSLSVKEQLTKVNNAFSQSREVSAQETAMRIISSMKLSDKSRQVTYVDSATPARKFGP